MKKMQHVPKPIVLGEQDIAHRSCLKNFQPTPLFCQDKCGFDLVAPENTCPKKIWDKSIKTWTKDEEILL